MFRSVLIVAAATGALMLSTAALAQKPDLGTAAEAKAMLERAVAELKIDEAAAIAKFNSGEAGFKDRDLYVFCFDMTTLKFTAAIKALLITHHAKP